MQIIGVVFDYVEDNPDKDGTYKTLHKLGQKVEGVKKVSCRVKNV